MNLHTIISLDLSQREMAQKWAEELSLNCFDGSVASKDPRALKEFIRKQYSGRQDECVLVFDNNGLALHALGLSGNSLSVRADFRDASTTYRRKKGGGKGQMIAKAVGLKGGVYPYVLDATAGLGKDAFVLASLGCRVTLLERSPIVHALLKDGLERAVKFGISEDAELLEILNRMQLIGSDGLDYMEAVSLEERPDVVYLDPMFPPRTKSAQVKKEMQVLNRLLGTEDSADALLESALRIARNRVVVKRPRTAPALSGTEPSYPLEGKRNRYDVYTF